MAEFVDETIIEHPETIASHDDGKDKQKRLRGVQKCAPIKHLKTEDGRYTKTPELKEKYNAVRRMKRREKRLENLQSKIKGLREESRQKNRTNKSLLPENVVTVQIPAYSDVLSTLRDTYKCSIPPGDEEGDRDNLLLLYASCALYEQLHKDRRRSARTVVKSMGDSMLSNMLRFNNGHCIDELRTVLGGRERPDLAVVIPGIGSSSVGLGGLNNASTGGGGGGGSSSSVGANSSVHTSSYHPMSSASDGINNSSSAHNLLHHHQQQPQQQQQQQQRLYRKMGFNVPLCHNSTLVNLELLDTRWGSASLLVLHYSCSATSTRFEGDVSSTERKSLQIVTIDTRIACHCATAHRTSATALELPVVTVQPTLEIPDIAPLNHTGVCGTGSGSSSPGIWGAASSLLFRASSPAAGSSSPGDGDDDDKGATDINNHLVASFIEPGSVHCFGGRELPLGTATIRSNAPEGGSSAEVLSFCRPPAISYAVRALTKWGTEVLVKYTCPAQKVITRIREVGYAVFHYPDLPVASSSGRSSSDALYCVYDRDDQPIVEEAAAYSTTLISSYSASASDLDLDRMPLWLACLELQLLPAFRRSSLEPFLYASESSTGGGGGGGSALANASFLLARLLLLEVALHCGLAHLVSQYVLATADDAATTVSRVHDISESSYYHHKTSAYSSATTTNSGVMEEDGEDSYFMLTDVKRVFEWAVGSADMNVLPATATATVTGSGTGSGSASFSPAAGADGRVILSSLQAALEDRAANLCSTQIIPNLLLPSSSSSSSSSSRASCHAELQSLRDVSAGLRVVVEALLQRKAWALEEAAEACASIAASGAQAAAAGSNSTKVLLNVVAQGHLALRMKRHEVMCLQQCLSTLCVVLKTDGLDFQCHLPCTASTASTWSSSANEVGLPVPVGAQQTASSVFALTRTSRAAVAPQCRAYLPECLYCEAGLLFDTMCQLLPDEACKTTVTELWTPSSPPRSVEESTASAMTALLFLPLQALKRELLSQQAAGNLTTQQQPLLLLQPDLDATVTSTLQVTHSVVMYVLMETFAESLLNAPAASSDGKRHVPPTAAAAAAAERKSRVQGVTAPPSCLQAKLFLHPAQSSSSCQLSFQKRFQDVSTVSKRTERYVVVLMMK
mmetsp:Transcript_5613/g.9223  ORF Transcript_5613/g.9223 Transcript_5613/m.9223 type:complete len:1135 (-) Transcript_5613:480-3884(-)